MSEPVTNAEVEDVLSSIRRLVSENKRPLQASGPAGENAPKAAAPQSEGQTVQEGEFKSARVTPSDTDASEAASSDDFTPHLSIRSASNGVTRPLSLTQAMQTEDDRSGGTAERPFVSARGPSTPPPAKAPDPSSDRLVLTPALRVATSDGKDRPTPAAIEPAKVTPLDYDMLHDDPSDLHAEDFSSPPQDAVAEVKAPAEPVAEKQIETPTKPISEVAAKASSGSRSDKLAALETAIGKITDDWDPDSPGDNDYSGTEPPAMEWKDDVELDTPETPIADTATVEAADTAPRARPTQPSTPQVEEQVRRFADTGPRVADPAATAPEFGYAAPAEDEGMGGEDQFLDEEALRDLVTEIVRAELQGALGERITRNVRKLVRREIHRAMTAQDLE
ncbi:hypothetical protein DSM110093_00917 [Sulfitobacter sp. DSM 110093]|uniref:hypothetical protein n=1 Tax=Sulfitobacter sp. DSM 110093 TaxID=2883127 RepID=UPI001FAC0EF9|nr:hypothetical protein [Sulfitobacter sp. DSM 110093]UOA31156.1 hypothetical protein DSM110093_00917 [Sulfitobacter sp. DSM 110093]